MKTKQKVVSLKVLFNDKKDNTYVMVETDDIDIANQIAQDWAEKKVGKKAKDVVMNKCIMDAPDMEPDEKFKGYQVWELAFYNWRLYIE